MYYGTLDHGLNVVSHAGVLINSDAAFWSYPPKKQLELLAWARSFQKYANDMTSLDWLSFHADTTDHIRYAIREPGVSEAINQIDKNPFATDRERQIVQMVLDALEEAEQKSKNKRITEPTLRKRVITRDNSTCRYCGKHLEKGEIRIDHIIPYSLGGLTEYDNLAVACNHCNSVKSGKTLQESGMQLLPVE